MTVFLQVSVNASVKGCKTVWFVWGSVILANFHELAKEVVQILMRKFIQPSILSNWLAPSVPFAQVTFGLLSIFITLVFNKRLQLVVLQSCLSGGVAAVVTAGGSCTPTSTSVGGVSLSAIGLGMLSQMSWTDASSCGLRSSSSESVPPLMAVVSFRLKEWLVAT